MKVIITGSTGMVGKGVLLECLASEEVSEVLVANRSKLDMEHSKLKELIIPDFYDLSKKEEWLEGYDACYFCLGTSSVGKSEEEYTRISYDLTLHFAKTVLKMNPNMVFTYVSGVGTSTEMNAKMMWANVKGRTENDLLKLSFKDAYMFRPGFILPLKGIRAKAWYQIFYDISRPIFPLLKKSKSITDTVRIGRAMLNVTLHGNEKKILEPEDINEVAVKSS